MLSNIKQTVQISRSGSVPRHKMENPNRRPMRNEAEMTLSKEENSNQCSATSKTHMRTPHTGLACRELGWLSVGPLAALKRGPSAPQLSSSKPPCALRWFAAVKGTASDIPRVKCTLAAAGTQGGGCLCLGSACHRHRLWLVYEDSSKCVCVPDSQ